MPQLIAVTYPDIFKAEEVRLALWKLQRDYLLELEDAVVVTKNGQSKVKFHQAVNMTTIGAVSGGFWGTLIGMIFLNPILGAAVGAASGAISGAVTDVGINDAFMKGLAEKFEPNTSALFVLVRHATPDKVVAEIAKYGGTVLQSSLSHEDEAKLQAALTHGKAAVTPSANSATTAPAPPSTP
jgi:uncharacterized membrane protein